VNTNANTAPVKKEWLTIQEVSDRTGRSAASLRMMIKRRTAKGEQLRVKKEPGKRGDNWLFHSSEIEHITEQATASVKAEHATRNGGEQVDVVTFETYDLHRREWEQRCSQLEQGLMMYRYKFEELDRQVKMLPAPFESIPSKLSELEAQAAELAENKQSLCRSQETIKALEEALNMEKQRSWWDRLWKK